MATNISGYYGIFKSPLSLNPKYGNSMYCVTDVDKTTLICIVLSPDALYDLYNLCKLPTYQNIYIIPFSMDILFDSSICNAILYLSTLKPNIKWIYPTEFNNTIVLFEDHQIISSDYSIPEYTDFSIQFIQSTDVTDRIFYDLIVYDGTKSIYFANYFDATKAEELYNNSSIDEIHVSYDSTIYGGLSYLDLIKIDTKYRSKFVVHSFMLPEDYEICIDNDAIHVGEVKYSYFI